MKFIFETEDEQEALIYSNAPNFYTALYKINELLLRNPGYLVGELQDKINEIISKECHNFYDIH